MHALLLLIGLLLGTAPPISLAAISTLQWIELGVTVAGDVPKAVKMNRQLMQIVQSPAFARWVAANGAAAIRLQPGIQDRYPR